MARKKFWTDKIGRKRIWARKPVDDERVKVESSP
jgi:hypothetical protein